MARYLARAALARVLRKGNAEDSIDRQRKCFRDSLQRCGDNAEMRETLSGACALYYSEPVRRVSYKSSTPHGRWHFSDDYEILKVKYNTWGDDDYAGEYVFRRSGWTWTYIYYGDAPLVQGFPWRHSFSDYEARSVLVFRTKGDWRTQ